MKYLPHENTENVSQFTCGLHHHEIRKVEVWFNNNKDNNICLFKAYMGITHSELPPKDCKQYLLHFGGIFNANLSILSHTKLP